MITKHDLELIDGFTFSEYQLKEYVFLMKVNFKNTIKYICVKFMEDKHFHNMNFYLNNQEEFLNKNSKNNVQHIYETIFENTRISTPFKKINHLIGIDLYFLLEYLNEEDYPKKHFYC